MADSPRDEQLPDDIWAKFQEDSWGRISDSAPKEPSARARMVEDRLRRADATSPRPRPRRPRPRWLTWRGGLRPWAIGAAALAGVVTLSWLVAQIPAGWIF